MSISSNGSGTVPGTVERATERFGSRSPVPPEGGAGAGTDPEGPVSASFCDASAETLAGTAPELFTAWTWKLSGSGKRAEVSGPDSRYRCTVTPQAAARLCAELNAVDSRVARNCSGTVPEKRDGGGIK